MMPLRALLVASVLLPVCGHFPALTAAEGACPPSESGSGSSEGEDKKKKEEKITPLNTVCSLTGKPVNEGIEPAEIASKDDKGKAAKAWVGFADNDSRVKFKKADAKTRALWIEAATANKVISVVNGTPTLVDPPSAP
jgi:hypothetical protein